jgi:hypothetical protein
MNLAQIEEQLQKMLLLGFEDKGQQIFAWEACVALTSFWKQMKYNKENLRDWNRYLYNAQTELENSVEAYHKERRQEIEDSGELRLDDLPF